MARGSATATLVAGSLLAGAIAPSPVFADCAVDTECVQIEPDRGPAGTEISVTATVWLKCGDSGLALRFSNDADGGESHDSANPTPVGEGVWTFVVPPELAPGTWELSLVCADTSTADAYDTGLTFIVTDPPDTATAIPDEPVTGHQPPAWVLVVAALAGLAAGLARRRPAPRCASRDTPGQY